MLHCENKTFILERSIGVPWKGRGSCLKNDFKVVVYCSTLGNNVFYLLKGLFLDVKWD